jgi:hypothetical protein
VRLVRLRINRCGVCKGTPVVVTGRPHPDRARTLAAEKRLRRQFAIWWTVSRCAPTRRQSYRNIASGFSTELHTAHFSARPQCFSRWQCERAVFLGVIALVLDEPARIWRRSWEVRLTDRMLAADSRALADVYNLRSLPSIFDTLRASARQDEPKQLVLPFFCDGKRFTTEDTEITERSRKLDEL